MPAYIAPASKNIRIYIAETEDVASGILDKLFLKIRA